jgi:hypothetical protein
VPTTAKYGSCNRHGNVNGSFLLIVVPPEIRHHLNPSLPLRRVTSHFVEGQQDIFMLYNVNTYCNVYICVIVPKFSPQHPGKMKLIL